MRASEPHAAGRQPHGAAFAACTGKARPKILAARFMAVRILIVSPLFPPGHGGLPDHTDLLAQELSRHTPVTVLTSPGREPRTAFAVRDTVADWQDAAALREAVEAAAPPEAALLWQYVPHMYGRGGVNFAVPRVIGALRARGRRQVVIAHEIAAPFGWRPHHAWYALAHRLMWRGVRRHAEAVGISTEAWLPGAGDARFFLAPSPSNVPVLEVPADHRTTWRAGKRLPPAGVVLAYFGTLGADKQFDWVLAAWRAARRAEPETSLVVIGAGPEPAMDAAERAHYRALGYQAADEVSRALQAADVLLLPFVDGASERRGSFMAGLAHGCAVLTTTGHSTGPALRRAKFFATTRADDLAAFGAAAAGLARDAARRLELGAAARAAYAETYDWPVLGRRLLQHA